MNIPRMNPIVYFVAFAMLTGCTSHPRYVVLNPGEKPLSRKQVALAATDARIAVPEYIKQVAGIDPGPLESKIEVVSMKMPDYPVSARTHAIEGTVVIEFIVGKRGQVEEALVVRSAHPLLEKAALESIMTWRFRPIRIHGEPARVTFRQKFPFVLSN
jgi:TonB family protein